MSDTVFKSMATEPSQPVSLPESKDASMANTSHVDVPYLDYHTEHGKPYTTDYFELGDHWQDMQGGFPREIEQIESYLEEKIKSGEIANDVKSVKKFFKQVEKLTNLQDEVRAVVKIETIADYIKFLKSTDERRTNLRRLYG